MEVNNTHNIIVSVVGNNSHNIIVSVVGNNSHKIEDTTLTREGETRGGGGLLSIVSQ